MSEAGARLGCTELVEFVMNHQKPESRSTDLAVAEIRSHALVCHLPQ